MWARIGKVALKVALYAFSHRQDVVTAIGAVRTVVDGAKDAAK